MLSYWGNEPWYVVNTVGASLVYIAVLKENRDTTMTGLC